MDIRIYVATHKRFETPREDIYIPLHVGKQGKPDLGYRGDDTGEHISGKNPMYCELTGMYWMWKNVSCDIIGLCHYRRYFMREHQPLRRDYIEELMGRYQMILGNSSMSEYGSAYEHYAHKHYARDLDVCREIIGEQCPDYLDAYDLAMHSNLMNIGNMLITTKKLYDDYCGWLFGILEEAERRIDIADYDDYQRRIFGFLAERLLRVWVMMQPVSVREEMIEQTEIYRFRECSGYRAEEKAYDTGN